MKVRILLVEDDVENCAAIEQGIGAADREVHIARNETEAGRLIAEIRFDLIITDINLRESGGGGSATGGIKVMELERASGRNTPIIVVTGYAKTEVVCGDDSRGPRLSVEERATQLGCIAFLKRNRNTRDDLVARVNDMLPDTHGASGRPDVVILHLSDLHASETSDPEVLVGPLVKDLRDGSEGLGIERLDYLVVSGDLTNRATEAEFLAARRFVSRLQHEMDLSAERCIVVPGNHDVDWSVPVYDQKRKRECASPPPEGTYTEQGVYYSVRNDQRYPKRFDNFAVHFYEPLFGRSYPREPEEQGQSFCFPQDKLLILAFNSAWQIDEDFQHRSSIQDKMLARALRAADGQARNGGEPWHRLAVWHHPVTGRQGMEDSAFLEQLRRADVKACLHGHVHEDSAELVGYLHPTRKLHIIGAGSFGAASTRRPPNVPRLYNVLRMSRDTRPHTRWIEVHTRCLHRDGGAWRPWAVWPGKGGEPRAWYRIGAGGAGDVRA